MPSLGIVERFNVFKNVGTGGVARRIEGSAYALFFQRSKEALHRCIVPTIAAPTHAADDAFGGQQALEILAGVLGEFNPSSQHLLTGGCDEYKEAAF